MMMIVMWIGLITLITSQHVHSNVITINTTGGSDNTTCCVDGECVCTSLSTALHYMTSNTIVNITSESVTLEGNIKMGSGDLNNITITGNDATIMCNNSGGVYCELCDNVVIEGITWDRCGDPNGINTAGLAFINVVNISIIRCIFQHSQTRAVNLEQVSGNIRIFSTNFTSNSKNVTSFISDTGGLSIEESNTRFNFVNVAIKGSNFCGNGYFGNDTSLTGNGLSVKETYFFSEWSIFITNTTFTLNSQAASFYLITGIVRTVDLAEINVTNNFVKQGSTVAGIVLIIDVSTQIIANLSLVNSVFEGNEGSVLWWDIGANQVTFVMSNCIFTNNNMTAVDDAGFAMTFLLGTAQSTMIVDNVNITNVYTAIDSTSNTGGIIGILLSRYKGLLNFKMTGVSFQSNTYYGDKGGVVYINYNSNSDLQFVECKFCNNTSFGNGAALYIGDSNNSAIQISDTIFDHNILGDSVVFVQSTIFNGSVSLALCSSHFTNNVGSSLYLNSATLVLCKNVSFINNTADNGPALYLDHGTTVTFSDNVTVLFGNNSAELLGGAIFIDLLFNCPENGVTFSPLSENVRVQFTNNVARGIGNAVYFSIPKYCYIVTDIKNVDSILHVPCQFNYSQATNKIPCDCIETAPINNSVCPVVTSPHHLRLYNQNFRFENNRYFIGNVVLGQLLKFNGSTFDYFDKPAESTQFNADCVDCSTNFTSYPSRLLVDNETAVGVQFSGENIQKNINVTMHLSSILHYYQQMEVILVIELMPCLEYPGFVYNNLFKKCVCYNHNLIRCYDGHNEIKRGYWFGSVDEKPTTSQCPSKYCNFLKRPETTQGFYRLSNRIDSQCNHHRSGIACGDCSPGYYLAYDSPDCVSAHWCHAGWTFLAVVLTCVYWILVVFGVFILAYKFELSPKHVYGVIYYYSMVGILLDNNPSISDVVLQFVFVLSSFAQATPQVLGKLCLWKGLSGIDQLFIHYIHAAAILLLTLGVVYLARWSQRIERYVSAENCGIRVICLLLLLAYTSIASTSLQLLRPLRFNDIDGIYTYASPHIKYFHGRHLIYGIVAVLLELVVLVSPLIFVFERYINFNRNCLLKLKPLQDVFKGCYDDDYRSFGAFYLYCRHMIMLIVFLGNRDYYNMLFYLQTVCVAIAMIHIWVQPYQEKFMNALDGFILLVMVLVVNLNTFSFPQTATTLMSFILVIAPIISVTLSKFFCNKKQNEENNQTDDILTIGSS